MSGVKALAIACVIALIWGGELQAIGERFGAWLGRKIVELIGGGKRW